MHKIFAVDFDGTLTDSKNQVPEIVRKELSELKEYKYIRILATGRSYLSLLTVIDRNFPIDYLVFSGGIGVMNWISGEIIKSNHFTEIQTLEIFNFLNENNFDFMVQYPVPDNHVFYHNSSGKYNTNFESRIQHYKNLGVFPADKLPSFASQFVVICNDGENLYESIKSRFFDYIVTRATSPLDNKSNWIEIFPTGVSKAKGIDYIRKIYNIGIENVIAVGNDYYDVYMLDYVIKQNAFVVANAPEELRRNYRVIDSNDDFGVAKLIIELKSL